MIRTRHGLIVAVLAAAACKQSAPAPAAAPPQPPPQMDRARGAGGAEGGEGSQLSEIAVTVDGKPGRWTAAELGRVKILSIPDEEGGGARQGWSLRDLATTLVGPKAAVRRVVGENGKAVAIEPSSWTDTNRVPALKTNRRGQIKFFWLTAQLAPIPKTDIRAVKELEITTGSP
jgi:hypothetical protein